MPTAGHDHAHLFAQSRTRRIRQDHGFDRSTGSSTSPLRTKTSLANPGLIFMSFRGPQAHVVQDRKTLRLMSDHPSVSQCLS